MYMHFNKRSGLMAPLVAEDVYEIIMKVRFWFSPDAFLTGAPVSTVLICFWRLNPLFHSFLYKAVYLIQ
jgi:hypothetical protein